MLKVSEKIHRILAPRLVVVIGTADQNGRQNIIPINNITSISTDRCMIIVAIHYPWITAKNLKTAKGFTVSVPHKEQLELVWKLGQKYSGYDSGKEKVEEFQGNLNLEFSEHGPVLKDALGWIEFDVIDLPKDVGGNHLMAIGQYKKAKVNPKYYNEEISPLGNPKPFMQWGRNNFAEASDIFSADYFKVSDL